MTATDPDAFDFRRFQSYRLRWDWEISDWKPIRKIGDRWVRAHAETQNCKICGRLYIGRRPSKTCIWCTAEMRPIQRKAIQQVNAAVRRGDLPALTGQQLCHDCGQPAVMYDHRDYRNAMDVHAVCASCNCRRGRAVWRAA